MDNSVLLHTKTHTHFCFKIIHDIKWVIPLISNISNYIFLFVFKTLHTLYEDIV